MGERQITVYSQPFAGPCAAFIDSTRKGVEFVRKDLMIDEEARDELFRLGVRSAPALVVDGGSRAIRVHKARINALLNL